MSPLKNTKNWGDHCDIFRGLILVIVDHSFLTLSTINWAYVKYFRLSPQHEEAILETHP